jgi:hypothetical protein
MNHSANSLKVLLSMITNTPSAIIKAQRPMSVMEMILCHSLERSLLLYETYGNI